MCRKSKRQSPDLIQRFLSKHFMHVKASEADGNAGWSQTWNSSTFIGEASNGLWLRDKGLLRI